MIDKYDQSAFLVIKAAYLYYIKDCSQSRIAQQMNISVPTVSRLLKKAKEDHIIEFVIRDSYIDCIRLEEELKERFGLTDVIIAPGFLRGHEKEEMEPEFLQENVKKMVALEAARYLQRVISPTDVLGVTWGTHVYHMINYLNPSQKVDAAFVTLHGSISCCDTELDVRTLVSRMAKAFSGRKYSLMSESLFSSRRITDALKREKNNAAVFAMFDKVNLAVNGVGAFAPEVYSTLAQPNFLSAEDMEKLKAADVCGDIALRFFDSRGKECRTDLSDRMLAIGLEQFRRIERKITIASGINKKQALLSAIEGDLVDVLIIDNQLAQELLCS